MGVEMLRFRVALLAVVVGLAVGWSRPAQACTNGMHQDDGVRRSPGEKLLSHAMSALRRRKFDQAVTNAQSLLQDEAKYGIQAKFANRVLGLAHLGLAETAERQATPDLASVQTHSQGALDALNAAWKDGEQGPYLQAKLGEAELGAGQPDAALGHLEPLAKDGMIPDAASWLALAKARHQKGNAAGAREALGEALKLAPDNPAALAFQKALKAKGAPPPDATHS